MDALAVVPMLVAIGTATLALLVRRFRRLQVGVSVLGGVAYVGAVGYLCWRVVLAPGAPGAVAYQVGDWPAPFGITLVVDALSAFVLAMAAAVVLPALIASTRYLDPADERVFYHPLLHFLVLGVTGAVLTGDLFNLFVWFEVLLMASYVFIAFYGGAKHTGASMRFLTLNLVGSAVMLVAIGGLYGVTGTLNMADMAQRLADPASHGVAVTPVLGLAGLLLSVFALKAGLVPFQFWVPSAYTAAPLPITAVFAGATKKVGMYAIVRLYFTVFSEAPLSVELPGIAGDSPLALLGPILLVMATGSVVVGGLGALHGESLEEVFAYSSIGQVGFIAVPVGLAALATDSELRQFAIAAALVFALHHALSKGMLFLAAGAVRSATGTSQLHALGGLAKTFPALSGAFFVGLLSLVGIPPLSGFFGKFLAFEAGVRGGSVLALAVLLGGSLLTIAYATRTWNEGFWDQPSIAVAEGSVDRLQIAVPIAMALAVIALGVGFEPVYDFAERAAAAATDTSEYVDVVDPDGGEST